MEDLDLVFEELEMSMEMSMDHLNQTLKRIRTGKASADMLDGVMVDYYGSPTPLNQVGNISIADARMLTVTPWEKSTIPAIDKAIREANLGLNPVADGDMVRVPVPALNEERRKQLVKQAKSEGEETKQGIRSNRKSALDALKKLKDEGVSEDDVKTAEKNVQEVINNYNKKIDDIIKAKEDQIMTV